MRNYPDSPLSKKNLLLLSSVLLASLPFVTTANAQVATQPVGYSSLTITPGTGAARAITTLGVPLYSPATTAAGLMTGTVSSLTATTLTVTGAAWTANELSQAATPYVIRITSGTAEGRNLLVSTSTANTVDTVTIDTVYSAVTDLTTLGISAGTDTYEIIECDTLLSLFGAPVAGGIVGGADSSTADVVYVFVGGSWSRFYFDTDDVRWTKITFGSPDASNQVLMPDAGLMFSRLSTDASEFTITGTVPDTKRSVTVYSAGVTPVGSAWPADVTLAASGVQSTGSWVSSADSNVADKVYIFNATWKRYYHDGTNWREITFGTPISDSVVIPSGAAVMLSKTAAAGSNTVLTQALPYTL